MGVSEACYIPAALALIADYHRGPTRSLATGMHISGVYRRLGPERRRRLLGRVLRLALRVHLLGAVGVGYAAGADVPAARRARRAADRRRTVHREPPARNRLGLRSSDSRHSACSWR